MKRFVYIVLSALTASAQVVIPATNGSLPVGGANGCADGYYPGTATVIFTVPYTYQQVLSVIGNYTNLTWSGSPDNSVTTNATSALATNDWGPGDARTYDIAGAHIIETITTYQKPANGPYIEIHTLAPLTIPAANVSFYSNYDAQNYTSICDGKATTANFTINFCATNATVGATVLHQLHMTDAQTVGMFLGGMNYTSCAALGSSSNGTTTSSNGTATSSSGTATSSGGAATSSSGAATSSSGAATLPSGTATSTSNAADKNGVGSLAFVKTLVSLLVGIHLMTFI